jgi:uncharacterized lipoprotein YmbA
MKKRIMIASTFALAGCAGVTVVKPQADVLSAHNGQPLTVVTYEEPSFVAMTAGVDGPVGACGKPYHEQLSPFVKPARPARPVIRMRITIILRPVRVNKYARAP